MHFCNVVVPQRPGGFAGWGFAEKCHHIQVVLTIDNPMGLPIKSKVDHWYHPRARNAVKEVTVTNFGDDNAHTGTSVLKSHTKND